MNEILIGATVAEVGTKNATITDALGNFKLQVSSDNAMLVVSYIGYEDLVHNVTETSNVKLVLMESGTSMEEVHLAILMM